MRIRKRAVGLVIHPALSKITFCPGSAIVLGMESDPYIYFLRYIGSINVYKVFTVSYLEDQCRAALLFLLLPTCGVQAKTEQGHRWYKPFICPFLFPAFLVTRQ